MKQGTLILKLSLWSFLLFSSNETLANPQVLIPAGEFKMGTEKGTRAEQPVHSIWIDGFFLDRYEVANKDYEKINPKFRRSQASPCDDCPVTGISWEEAKNYCQYREMSAMDCLLKQGQPLLSLPKKMDMDYIIWKGMYGNGRTIGLMKNTTIIRRRKIHKAQAKGFVRWFVGVVGIIIFGICKPGCAFGWLQK